ncbi:hypothetical protein AB0M10_15340 [Streptomyces sp. NPDC051840]|uniref:hypothetical protein n=1 Tax=Streptomyces sp. NPDC051840 TaxID=3154752 RepID=UPI00342A5DEA
MPLVQRPNPSWQAFQEVLPGTPTGGPRSRLAAGWPTELPDPRPGATPALEAASLPRHGAQPGTAPARGRPTRGQLGLGSVGAATTGAPSTSNGRSSIFSSPTY